MKFQGLILVIIFLNLAIYLCENNTSTAPNFPNFTAFANSSQTLSDVSNCFYYSISNDILNYYSNNCIDSRIIDPNGNFNVSQTDQPDLYQEICQLLAIDFGQVLANYTCNNWACNLQGQCQFTLDNYSNVNQTCICNTGWTGANCMFPTQDYTYGIGLLNGIISYVNALNTSNPITDETIFINVLSMTEYFLLFTSYLNIADANMMNQGVITIFNILMNANVTLSQATSDYVGQYLSEILSDNTLPPTFDPTQLLATYGVSDGTSTDTYGYSDNYVDPNNDMDIGLSFSNDGARRLFGRPLNRILQRRLYRRPLNRFLQNSNAIKPKVTTKTLNMANPQAFVPKDISSKLPSGSSISLSFVRDPKTYNNPNSPYLISQVVTLQVKIGPSVVSFPNTTTILILTIPWANVPLNCPNGNVQSSCYAYSLANNVWSIEPLCSLDNGSDSNNAILNCLKFGTFAVSCKSCSVDTKSLITAVSNVNLNSLSRYLIFSTIISFILTILLV